MALKGAALQNYNTELIHRIEELREKRDEIKKILQVEEEEKANIQKDLVVLTKRLAEIDDSLSRKYAYTNEYDKTIHEVEAAYSKILESSQALLHVLKSETMSISNKR
ncbi:sjoegren syndrome nuclear autoantigen 1 [Marchantia polymorpha subsp. ruderalis]|uniref:Uncharacterized protein n=2 Tax=Marchantia polymorpha TaxID=3197 RepID=A0AAF6AL17_MARPO|nr:hypothetical protein MARPO_0005s0276 [Marchantia polymorpha]BBM97137.1 hypothetical protein Mp_1g03310 [Marchantia polymorpha subsp. ruderalis]|eukprot:PTQ48665.1 hypothetical protein MARPO_0005s0276 [Marchantia polymorpha]